MRLFFVFYGLLSTISSSVFAYKYYVNLYKLTSTNAEGVCSGEQGKTLADFNEFTKNDILKSIRKFGANGQSRYWVKTDDNNIKSISVNGDVNSSGGSYSFICQSGIGPKGGWKRKNVVEETEEGDGEQNMMNVFYLVCIVFGIAFFIIIISAAVYNRMQLRKAKGKEYRAYLVEKE